MRIAIKQAGKQLDNSLLPILAAIVIPEGYLGS
jgi:hypothetical protein